MRLSSTFEAVQELPISPKRRGWLAISEISDRRRVQILSVQPQIHTKACTKAPAPYPESPGIPRAPCLSPGRLSGLSGMRQLNQPSITAGAAFGQIPDAKAAL